ncbi:MAG: M28 family peptidase [Bacteroidetes bacterium]|nr:M28 family peptidase [Bacteroidota bacterium]
MKNTIATFFLLLFFNVLFAQSNFNFDKTELENHLKYLASDELGGRRTASKGEQLAAGYIARQFQSAGVKPAPGQPDFFQKVPFEIVKPPNGILAVESETFNAGDNLLIINGKPIETATEAVFAGYGWVDEATGVDDYKDLDVRGKIVFTITGKPDSSSPMDVYEAMPEKQRLAAERGALALFEVYRVNIPWTFSKGYFGKERMQLGTVGMDAEPGIVYGWVQESKSGALTGKLIGKNTSVRLKVTASLPENIEALNVVGIIEGTDAVLKNEYVVLSAHYDHIGIGKQGGAAYTPQDSIFNGARDNGMGTVALLAAAKELAAHPPRRSVLLLACTAEEMGMLGSKWYADHPLIPLEKMVFNLNNDGAGYNTTAHVTVIGLGRTNTDAELEQAAKMTSLTLLGDPAPEQNLYERSDNISFAKKGIPAIDFAPGITKMNDEVYKYYHQAADNADSIGYDYLLRFCQAYVRAANLIANKTATPAWVPGDKFEKK